MKKIMIFRAIETVIKKAKELGYITVVVDREPNANGYQFADYYKCIDVNNFNACLKYAKEMKIDGVMPASDIGLIAASYVATNLNLPGINFEIAKLVRNKYEVQKKLEANNLNHTPQSFIIQNIDELENIKNSIHFPVIVKPNDGAGSVAVSRVENFIDLKNSCITAMNISNTNRALIQTFIIGKEYGVELFVYNNKVTILGVTQKIMTPAPHYVELGHIIPSSLTLDLENKLYKTVYNTINALNINIGPVNMDILITENNEIYIIDMSTRHGGNAIFSHLIPFSTGIDYLACIIKVTMGETVDLNTIYRRNVMSRILDLKPGIIKSLPDFSKYYDKDTIDIVFNLKVNDTIDSYVDASNVPGFIILTGNSVEDMLKKSLHIKNTIDKDIIRK